MRSEAPPPSGFHRPARRRFGQNFLVAPAAAERIVAALDPEPGEPVLEIGPGRGAITEPLVARAGRIAAVEVDRDLARELRSRFDPERLVLLEGDALRLDLADALRALGRDPDGRLAVAGNLPFNISKPFAAKMVRERARIGRAVLTFQREVADRILAGPGSKAYGPISVLAGFAFRIESLFDLPPGAFRPRPRVVSTVTRWIPRRDGGLDPLLEDRLRACLAACFGRRRRTLLANLREAVPGGAPRAVALLEAAGLPPDARAEAVPPSGFLALASEWPEGGARAGTL